MEDFMCLAVPMKVIEIDEKMNTGMVESAGIKRRIGFMLLEDVKIGEWVIVHTGFAISKLNEQEAQETLDLLREGGFIE